MILRIGFRACDGGGEFLAFGGEGGERFFFGDQLGIDFGGLPVGECFFLLSEGGGGGLELLSSGGGVLLSGGDGGLAGGELASGGGEAGGE